MENLKNTGISFCDFARDSGGDVIPNGVTRYNVINFAERVLKRYVSHTESYSTYNAKRTDVEIPAHQNLYLFLIIKFATIILRMVQMKKTLKLIFTINSGMKPTTTH